MLSILLTPFSILYGFVTQIRNLFYDRGWIKSYSFNQCAVIGVGNLSLGGTGKTPVIEYLVRLLLPRHSIAVLSRGYGRRTQGFRLGNDQDDATTLGDEPFQFYNKWKGKIKVAVCEDRVEGVNRLLKIDPKIEVVLLDDVFQHRRLKLLFSILLTEFSKPFFRDYLLPKGRLRESRRGSSRTDVVVVTKCNESRDEEKFKNAIGYYAGNKPVFFSFIKYLGTVPFGKNITINKKIILVTGIANSKPILNYARENFSLIRHFNFADHHYYSITDIESIQSEAGQTQAAILTTEKDWVKLIAQPLQDAVKKELWFYLSIEHCFFNSGSEFDKMIINKIEHHTRSNSN
ncbi:MAG: tetraacyldisaccharide 4'-kinase [Cytophagales bacterium]|nr:tetraacyldisaccharide 4'-kinase [Bacteroidota bacterium]MBS1980139.1 tetraacyldisaccharide 4'-kinase [Bacteroidota bacterium]WHZ08649.1 MAG: tetraacyldisaccharide 4'-kinase [Cytophagales bacterium]